MGLNDKEIVKEMDGGSTSTIRNHRFTRERNEASKSIFSANGIIRRKIKVQTKFVPIHRTATMVDDRYNITEEENDEVLKAHLQKD